LTWTGIIRLSRSYNSPLESGEGFIMITGEVGTGKTLICRRLLNTLEEDFVSAYVPNPFLTPDSLILALA